MMNDPAFYNPIHFSARPGIRDSRNTNDILFVLADDLKLTNGMEHKAFLANHESAVTTTQANKETEISGMISDIASAPRYAIGKHRRQNCCDKERK
ncbi:MAG: hypothetical protein H6817_05570 [Phycisphaerales bacterium]|nr:hypothetical protein [Phycisphaerales bacterium]